MQHGGNAESKDRRIGNLCKNGSLRRVGCVCMMDIMWKVVRPCSTKFMLMVNVMYDGHVAGK